MISDEDFNYWPSFVDLMSSLFIIILTVFFVLFLSQQYLSYLVGKGENDLMALRNLFKDSEVIGVKLDSIDARITIGESVLFGFNDYQLTTEGEKIILKVGSVLKEFLNNERKRKFSIVVEGHTDTRGTSTYNKEFSFKRAKEVTDRWETMLKFGIEADTLFDIFPAGYGESRLAVKTDDNVKKDENRRVEIRVVPKFDEMLSEILKKKQ